MTRWLAGCMALAALVAVLDAGSRTADAAPSVSRFAGNWAGTWSIPVNAFDGTFDWTISNAGQIKGTVYNNQAEARGTVVGHVGEDGKITVVGFAPADAPSDWFNGFAFQGTAGIDGDGKLVVSVIRTDITRNALDATLERT